MDNDELKQIKQAITDITHVAASMVTYKGMPSPYHEDMEFCKTTPIKDKRRRMKDNMKSQNIVHRHALRLIHIMDGLREITNNQRKSK